VLRITQAHCRPGRFDFMELPAMNKLMSTLCVPAAGIATLVLVAGCVVSKETKESVAKAEATVQQAQSALGSNEAAAVDVQRAKDHLAAAQKAVEDGDDKPAMRHAQQAELDAQLAVAKAQHSTARKAADELQASINQIRQESQRSTDAPR
jgi:hypothetical protein